MPVLEDRMGYRAARWAGGLALLGVVLLSSTAAWNRGREDRGRQFVPPVENPRFLPLADGPGGMVEPTPLGERPVRSILDDRAKAPAVLRVRTGGASMPIVTPITVMVGSMWDYQHDDDGTRQIGTQAGGTYVHFVVTSGDLDSTGTSYRYVSYQAYKFATLSANFGWSGDPFTSCGWPCNLFAGFTTLDMATGDVMSASYEARSETQQPDGGFSSWVTDTEYPGLALYHTSEMPQSVDRESRRPKLAIDAGGSSAEAPGDDVFHVIAYSFQGGGELHYWRRIGGGAGWAGPVCLDASPFMSHHPAVDATSEQVSVAYARDAENPGGLVDVVYLTSANNGQDWIDAGIANPGMCVGPIVNGGRHNITNYTDGNGPQSWTEITSEYDLAGDYHVIWVEQAVANASSDCRIRHWSDATGTISTVASGMGFGNVGGDGVRDLWLAYPQMGFGDGSTLCTDGPANPGPAGANSNLDYVYVTFEQYGGRTSVEANDVSDSGFMNLDVYLGVSNDGGLTWARPVNLTNTKTPGCSWGWQNPCLSERDPSIAKVIDDTIHVMYIEDHDAGDAVFGQGAWTYNDVQYLRIPGGTDAPYLCPEIAPVMSAALTDGWPGCPYTTTPGDTVVENFVIENLGNSVLSGAVTTVSGASWLQFTTGPFAIPPGAADARIVVMDATAPPLSTSEGIYADTIRITHNDPGQPSPIDIPVEFHVFCYSVCLGECICSTTQGDYNGDGQVDSADLASVIDVVFFGGTDLQDGNCPKTRSDFDGDGVVDSVDLALMIDYVFFGGAGPVEPCDC